MFPFASNPIEFIFPLIELFVFLTKIVTNPEEVIEFRHDDDEILELQKQYFFNDALLFLIEFSEELIKFLWFYISMAKVTSDEPSNEEDCNSEEKKANLPTWFPHTSEISQSVDANFPQTTSRISSTTTAAIEKQSSFSFLTKPKNQKDGQVEFSSKPIPRSRATSDPVKQGSCSLFRPEIPNVKDSISSSRNKRNRTVSVPISNLKKPMFSFFTKPSTLTQQVTTIEEQHIIIPEKKEEPAIPGSRLGRKKIVYDDPTLAAIDRYITPIEDIYYSANDAAADATLYAIGYLGSFIPFRNRKVTSVVSPRPRRRWMG